MNRRVLFTPTVFYWQREAQCPDDKTTDVVCIIETINTMFYAAHSNVGLQRFHRTYIIMMILLLIKIHGARTKDGMDCFYISLKPHSTLIKLKCLRVYKIGYHIIQ